MRPGEEFFNLYNHNFARVAVAVPRVRVADAEYNAAETVLLMQDAAKTDSVLVVFPELGLSAYSCDDLFHQKALLDACLEGLRQVVDASAAHQLVCIVGAPLQVDHLLFNCAVIIQGGRILGVVPKTYLPNYREFYEQRYFAPADAAVRSEIDLLGRRGIPFGNRPAVPDSRTAVVRLPCRDLRGPLGAHPAVVLCGAGGRHVFW